MSRSITETYVLLMQALGAIGFFLSLLIKRGRPTNSLGVGIVGGAFFLEILSRVTVVGGRRIVIFGTSEFAEMAYLSLREMDMELVGFVSDGTVETFLSYPVSHPSVLKEWEFDAVVLADLDRSHEQGEMLVQYQVPNGKVLVLGPTA